MQHASTHVKLLEFIVKTCTNSRTWFTTKKTDTVECMKNMHCQKRMRNVRRNDGFVLTRMQKHTNVLNCTTFLIGSGGHKNACAPDHRNCCAKTRTTTRSNSGPKFDFQNRSLAGEKRGGGHLGLSEKALDQSQKSNGTVANKQRQAHCDEL